MSRNSARCELSLESRATLFTLEHAHCCRKEHLSLTSPCSAELQLHSVDAPYTSSKPGQIPPMRAGAVEHRPKFGQIRTQTGQHEFKIGRIPATFG